MEFYDGFVTWSALEDALRGLRQEYENSEKSAKDTEDKDDKYTRTQPGGTVREEDAVAAATGQHPQLSPGIDEANQTDPVSIVFHNLQIVILE